MGNRAWILNIHVLILILISALGFRKTSAKMFSNKIVLIWYYSCAHKCKSVCFQKQPFVCSVFFIFQDCLLPSSSCPTFWFQLSIGEGSGHKQNRSADNERSTKAPSFITAALGHVPWNIHRPFPSPHTCLGTLWMYHIFIWLGRILQSIIITGLAHTNTTVSYSVFGFSLWEIHTFTYTHSYSIDRKSVV